MKKIIGIAVVVGCLMAAGGYVVKRYGMGMGFYLSEPSAKEYAEMALNLMNNGLYATSEEWGKAREKALKEAENASSYKDTYLILEEALKVAGGKHSRLIEPLSTPLTTEEIRERHSKQKKSMAEMRERDLCYIRVPDFGGDAIEAEKYVDNIYKVLRENKENIKGVIIDLRQNTGGDMGAMVTAVGPLLPDGEVMNFDVRGQKYPVRLKDGIVTGGGNSVKIDDPIKIEDCKIAILQDTLTASSGEATLLCFRGLENTRTFGTKSAGYCSSNMTYWLYDNTVMLLTVGEDVARTGEHFSEEPIEPDVETENCEEEATKWLKEAMR